MDPSRPQSSQTRREFCVHTCQAVSLLGLGALIEGCGGSPTSPTGSVPSLPVLNGTVMNGAIALTIDAGSPLASVGNAALLQTSSGNFLVARTAQDTFVALTAVCTHEACTITGYQNQMYTCPCHGSQYNTNGAVLRGPAPASLRQFSTQFANGVLTITV